MLKHDLTFLFDLVHCYAYVPTVLKQGILLTLYTSEGKPKSNSNSYPSITLSSSLLKLYEKVLLGELHVSIDKPLHSLQGDFQSNMAS